MHQQQKVNPEIVALRKQAGTYLKGLRAQASLTQREVSIGLNMKYYTMVAQMEAGTARVPPESYTAYAEVLGVDAQTFTIRLMEYNDPHIYKVLFGKQSKGGALIFDNHRAELHGLLAQVSAKGDEEVQKVSKILNAYLS
jgi:transcriptional regulator with XRE-family HTH domain